MHFCSAKESIVSGINGEYFTYTNRFYRVFLLYDALENILKLIQLSLAKYKLT